MRVLTFDPVPASNRGGQELSLVDECVGLARRGHAVTLGYLEEADLLPRYRDAGVATLRLSAIAIDRGATLRSALDVSASVVRALRVPAEVVLLNSYFDAFFGRAISRSRRVPLVCHLRIFPPDRFAGQWRLGLRGVTRFVAVSRAVADEWVALGACDPTTIDVVHDGVEVPDASSPNEREAARAELGIAPDAFVVIYAGRLDPLKNVEGVLHAFAKLDVPGAVLLVAGRPVAHDSPAAAEAYVERLRALAGTLGIADRTRWLGPRRDVLRLFRAADASILLAFNEAFGRTTVESLACGTPPVVSRRGGTAEILTGEFARFACDADRPEQVAATLRSVVGLRGRDPEFARRARHHARTSFGVDAMVQGVERSLREALATGWAERGPRGDRLPRVVKRAAR